MVCFIVGEVSMHCLQNEWENNNDNKPMSEDRAASPSCLRWARRVERHYVSGPLIALSTRYFYIKWRGLHDGANLRLEDVFEISVLVA